LLGTVGTEVLKSLVKFLFDELPKPSFLVEFSTRTRTLNLTYALPESLEVPDPKGGNRRFSGHLQPATFVETYPLGFGNLHFDMDNDIDVGEIDRAKLIMDLIENPYRVTNILGGHTYKKTQFAGVTPGFELPIPTDQDVDVYPNYKVLAGIRPRIVVEGMSPPDLIEPCGICIDGETAIVEQDGVIYYVITGILFKCYMAPHP
jgi:hypothetical protein